MATRRNQHVTIEVVNRASGWSGSAYTKITESHGEGETPDLIHCNRTAVRQFPVSWGLSDCVEALVAEANQRLNAIE